MIEEMDEEIGRVHLKFIIVYRGNPVIVYNKLPGLIRSSNYAEHISNPFDRTCSLIRLAIDKS